MVWVVTAGAGAARAVAAMAERAMVLELNMVAALGLVVVGGGVD